VTKGAERALGKAATTKTYLYRHFRADGVLLYVGVSLPAIQRLRAHSLAAEWFGTIANITIETCESRQDALAAEKKAIQIEKPLHNKRGHVVKPAALKPPTSTQLVTARTILRLTQDNLVKAMKVGSQTVVRVETAEGLARANRATLSLPQTP
jgi:hypothetical protein